MPNSKDGVPAEAAPFFVRPIPAARIALLWPLAEPFVKRALDHASGEVSPADLRAACAARDAQLWMVTCEARVVGAATTEIVRYPQRCHCRVITIAGSRFAEWVHQIDDTLAAWALGEGCDALEAHVRRGFAPKLAALGYVHKHSVVIKQLAPLPATTRAIIAPSQ